MSTGAPYRVGMRTAWVGVLLTGLLLGCAADPAGTAAPVGSSAAADATASPRAAEPGTPPTDGTIDRPATGRGSVPPAWLGTRPLPRTSTGFGQVRATPRALRERQWTLPDTVPMLPGRGFASEVVSPAPREVIQRSTWARGCPVGRRDLAWLRVTFRGFDDRRHTGELLVNRSVADDLVGVFGTLWRQRFPMERVVVVESIDQDAPPTGDGNGTGAFVCRAVTGGTSYSQHAYGLAIDVNTFQNPYKRGEVVLPELASSYLRRERVRPGMITASGPVVRAFAAIGWEWGGDWRTLKDFQHFSLNGR